ncbi:hypothetical protein PMIN04_006650 [Paraphaeosphaeria minitans]
MPSRKRPPSETCATSELSFLGSAKRRAIRSSPLPHFQRSLKRSLPLTQRNLKALEDSQKSSPDHDSSLASPTNRYAWQPEDDPRVLAAPLVYSKNEINLHRYFLPLPPDRTVKEVWKELSQPRPDTAIGYVTRRDAQSTDTLSATAFTAKEERLLDGFCLTQYLLFPFLTSQWKTPNSNENILHAHNQAARDGAVIVNYLYNFYSLAYPDQGPAIIDTAHYSFTCDLLTAQI